MNRYQYITTPFGNQGRIRTDDHENDELE